MKNAALLVIGDEILTGKIKDENIFVFTTTMFAQGITVNRIEIIPDDIPIIAKSVEQLCCSYDYVCTSGGIGPTHDDRTFEAIGRAFSLPLKADDEAIRYFQIKQQQAGRGSDINNAQKKMLTFPFPCQTFFLEPLWLPLVVVKNVYIFPGVPKLFAMLMKGFSHLFVGGKFFREEIVSDCSESEIAFDLQQLQDRNPDVAIGSYPQVNADYNVSITVLGCMEEKVQKVALEIIPLINGRKIS